MKNQLLCDSDWASMSHSVEVRAPFVDLKLLRTLGGMFGKAGAPTKRDMASTPRLKLPTEVLFRKKTGFTVPVRDWLMDKTDLFRERGLRGWAKTVYAEYAKSLGSSAVKLARYVPRSRDKKTVLIFRIGQLGDTLIAMPAIHAIRNKYPDHRLVLLTDQYYNRSGYVSSWNVLGPTGWFDDVLFYSPKTRYGVGNLKNLVKNIKELAPDHIYNVSPDRQPLQAKRDRVFFKYIIGVRNYHAFGASNAPQKMHPLPRIEAEWKRLMGIVNDRIENGPFRLPIQASERGIAENALHEAGISEDARIVAIGPGSKMPAKIWPAERYREVGRMILEKFPDVKLVVLGGREDWEIGERLCAEWGRRSFNFAGKLSIYGSAAVLERCVCYLGNDTGTMHLAAMVRIPCVAIFCARDYPGKWEPYGEKHRIIRKDVECAGCMLEVCSYNNRCLQLISVDDIFKELQGLI
jgi:ADP-heptose:LPS heptosyltransferase